MTNANDVSPSPYAWEVYDIAAPAILKALENPGQGKKGDEDLEKFVGRYDRALSREMYVLIMEGELAVISLPNDNPLDSLTRLKRVGENTFRRIRDDGNLGEEVVFELGPDGKVTCLIWHSNYAYRVDS
jgi:hypothetical protein